MLRKASALKLACYGALTGVLSMAIWIEFLNRWHMSEALYPVYAWLLGMGAVYGTVGTAAIYGFLNVFAKFRGPASSPLPDRRPRGANS